MPAYTAAYPAAGVVGYGGYGAAPGVVVSAPAYQGAPMVAPAGGAMVTQTGPVMAQPAPVQQPAPAAAAYTPPPIPTNASEPVVASPMAAQAMPVTPVNAATPAASAAAVAGAAPVSRSVDAPAVSP
jgi:hypothetical protein